MNTPNWTRAHCRNNPQQWDHELDPRQPESTAQRHTRYKKSIELCRTCPALTACRQLAAQISTPAGVLAGKLYPASERRLFEASHARVSHEDVESAFNQLMSSLRSQSRRHPVVDRHSPRIHSA
ncbi:WhiB family transcriptional regulator [Rhodococcus opacus]|uniref:WhiB family transcriptional regulator n=1 Tax=Rhodococcus opacus TaxID=37919 RepID=UPI00358EDB92